MRGVNSKHQDYAKHALRSTKTVLNRGNLPYEEHALAGVILPSRFGVSWEVQMRPCRDGVAWSALRSLFLGSVEIKILTHSRMPVTIVSLISIRRAIGEVPPSDLS